jgi:pimeloyl-ACP methyl ester carboxylesterase
LVHGLGRTARSLKRIEWTLEGAGYRVINESYPSTRLSVEEAANVWLASLLEDRTPDQSARIHFVTHSLGGLVVRQYLADHQLANLDRVVMLAPPNQGSELADRLKNNLLFKFIDGPAGQQLGTDSTNLPARLGPVAFELGVIAGDRSLNPLFSACLPKPNDGKISVQSTAVEGMREQLVIHGTHTWMMWRGDVARAVVRFLEEGAF